MDPDIDEAGAVATEAANELGGGIATADDDAEAPTAVAAVSEAAEEEAEGLLDADQNESWSDDPVRMYLTQMGEIPLLTRKEEICLARRIENTRTEFRRKLLACDYVIRNAVKVLERVHKGELPFDRTVQVSVTDRLEKDQILGRMPHNLKTLETLLARNAEDYKIATSKSVKMPARRAAWKRLGRRRCRAVTLVEELGLRTPRIEPMIDQLFQFHYRIQDLSKQLKRMKSDRRPMSERKPLIVEYRNILRALQETPTSLRNRVRLLRQVYAKYQTAKRGLSEGNLRLVVS
ncbi:MAG: sigma-70 factor domain-containing protein, partial [Planctomycetota bacterium]